MNLRQDDAVGKSSLGVVVTGGTSGLGRAMAREFLLAGDRVVVCGRDRVRLDAAVRKLTSSVPGCELYGMACDVSLPEEVSAFAAFAVSKLGTIDRWINNAGTAGRFRRPLWELDPKDIDETCRTNLSGTMMGCAEAVRVMRHQPFDGPGPRFHIFNMGFSLSGVRASPTAVPHRASKRAVALTTDFIRHELKSAGIDSIGVHELSPGLVLTGLLLKDAGVRERRLFNAVADTPDRAAAVLVPRIRSARGSGGSVRIQPIIMMLARLFASMFGFGRGRFFDDDGNRRNVDGRGAK
jgi:NAD(P)-dependent dehydrogenase (short-subunit alcohol dehydrogenase family)